MRNHTNERPRSRKNAISHIKNPRKYTIIETGAYLDHKIHHKLFSTSQTNECQVVVHQR